VDQDRYCQFASYRLVGLPKNREKVTLVSAIDNTEQSDRPKAAPKIVAKLAITMDPSERRPWSMRKTLMTRPNNSRGASTWIIRRLTVRKRICAAPKKPRSTTDNQRLRETQKRISNSGVALALNQSSVSGRQRLPAASKKSSESTAPTPEAAIRRPSPSGPTFKISLANTGKKR